MCKPSPAAGDKRLERAIVLALLSGDGEPSWSCARLAAELGIEAQALQGALGRLCEAGLVCIAGTEVWVSSAARHLDELGLIGI